MRELKVIEAEIAKLQAEAEDVRMDVSKKNAAVSILGNLGWTWTAKFGWKKPAVEKYPENVQRAIDRLTSGNFKAPVAAGDFATYVHVFLGGNVYVRNVNHNKGQATVSWVNNIAYGKILIETKRFDVALTELTVRPQEWIIAQSHTGHVVANRFKS